MSTTLKFVTLDVFTDTRFLGNPLAILHIPPDIPDLSQSQKQTLAREFNLSETVFLHESKAGADEDLVTIDIFTTQEELPFAGHPTVGTGWYLLSRAPNLSTVMLKTKAGKIAVAREHGKVRLQVPVDFKVHTRYNSCRLKSIQSALSDKDYVNGIQESEALVSIVKGMTFVLLELTSEKALARVTCLPERLEAPGLGEWDGLVALYAFYERSDGVLRTRMIDGPMEDAATGSAASSLAGFLALRRGEGSWTFSIVQGIEIGRRSEIEVWVVVDHKRNIRSIELGGSAVKVMEGSLQV